MIVDSYRRLRRVVSAVDNWYDLLLYHLGLHPRPIVRFRLGPRILYDPQTFGVEIFLEQPYSCVNAKGKTVVDIGAFIGDSALYFLMVQKADIVYAFEPFPYSYEIARKNVELNKAENILLFNEAVGAEESEITLNPQLRSDAGSVLASAPGIPVRIRSLESIVNDFGIQNAIMKVDCEGCEYEIFRRVNRRTMEAFDEIVLEYHRGCDDLAHRLEDFGYTVALLYDHMSPEMLGRQRSESGFLVARRVLQPASLTTRRSE